MPDSVSAPADLETVTDRKFTIGDTRLGNGMVMPEASSGTDRFSGNGLPSRSAPPRRFAARAAAPAVAREP